MKKTLFKLLVTSILFASNALAQTQEISLKVEVEGFENDKGKASIGIFDASEKFMKGFFEPIKGKKATIVFSGLKKGKYIVKAYHDENGNGRLDTGMFGIPKESWGVSNNIRPLASAPKAQDMLIDLKADGTIRILVK